MAGVFEEITLDNNKFRNKIWVSILLVIFCSSMIGYANTENDNSISQNNSTVIDEEVSPKHLVEAILLFDEIYDINISKGNYRVSAELMMTWDGATELFLGEFGDKIIHGKKLVSFLEKTWHPEFIIANAENPRTTHYKTLEVIDGKLDLFERFEADLSIDAIMPRYPFGDLDLFMEMAAFSGSQQLMRWKPVNLFIGHDDADHVVVKGNWQVQKTQVEETIRSSLNHGGKEKFSYLVSHVNVSHNALTAMQKVLLPLSSIILLSLVLNHFLTTTSISASQSRGLFNGSVTKISAQLTLFLVIPALKFALASDMPSTHYLNFTDGVFILSTFVVAINLLIAIATISLAVNGHFQKSMTTESFSRIVSPVVAIAGYILVLYLTSENSVH